MKKIIFIVSTLNAGGAQKILSNLLVNLPDRYEAYIVLNDKENIIYPYKGKIVSLGFKPQRNKLNLFYQMKVLVKRILVLRKMKATGEYVAAVSFLDSANIANVVSGRKKCRTILSVHNNLTESQASWVYKYFVNPAVRMLYGKADKVIAVSKGIAYDLIQNLKLTDKNIVTIYNGHNIDEIRQAAKQSVPDNIQEYFSRGVAIATMGRLDYQKGQWHLIRALKNVKEVFPDIQLFILGEGELHSYLERLAEECGLLQNIHFCGFSKNPFSILSKCKVFILPSMFEGFPNALIEALSCDLPCIATDFRSGAREILAPELPITEQIVHEIKAVSYGLLLPVCDGKQYSGKEPLTEEELLLAKAIIKMLSSTELQEKYQKSARNALRGLDTMSMVRKWIEVIEQ